MEQYGKNVQSEPAPIRRRSFLAAGLSIPLLGAAGMLQSCIVPGSRGVTASAEASSAPPSAPAVPSPSPAPLPAPSDIAARYGGVPAHSWGLNLPGVVETLPTPPKTIALTFDACGGPQGSLIDENLLATLESHNVPATLFLNKRWIDTNPARARQLAENPLYQIENHGTSHRPLSVNGRAAYGIPGTANVHELVAEIEENRAFMRNFLGVQSNWFRSGTAHYDDVAIRIAHDLGVAIAGFAVNGDSGATAPASTVTSQLTSVNSASLAGSASSSMANRPGAIAIMHMNQPRSGTAAGVRAAIPQLQAAGYQFVKLGAAPV